MREAAEANDAEHRTERSTGDNRPKAGDSNDLGTLDIQPDALDDWLGSNPWHPRVLPYLAYIIMLPIVVALKDWQGWTYPLAYTVQCVVTLWLIWKARRWLPEFNFKFHWLVLPIGVGVAVLWVGVGWWVAGEWGYRWSLIQEKGLIEGLTGPVPFEKLGLQPNAYSQDPNEGPFDFRDPAVMGPVLGGIALGLRLLGMSIVVPICEELFMRSALLRGLSSWKRVKVGMVQVGQDMPGVGDWLLHSKAGLHAAEQEPQFAAAFHETPLGKITLLGFVLSTGVFVLMHSPRDWIACALCAGAYCLLLFFTRHKGLGPTIWAHGVTNALLWAYTLHSGDWQFL